jgi:DNA-binding NtrC family response regulator
VLLISGFGTLETAIDAVRAGAFDYISKPFNIGEVKETVERALAQSRRRGGGARPAARGAAAAGLIGRTRRCCGLQADRARGRRGARC